MRLPWWLSGEDSAHQWRRHGFCPCTSTIEPVLSSLEKSQLLSPRALEPILHNRNHCNEKPEGSSHSPQLEKSLRSNEDPAQSKMTVDNGYKLLK